MTYLEEHLRERGMKPELYNLHLDEDEGLATFLLYNFTGQITGYHQYRPAADKTKKNHPREGRYFTYVKEGQDGFFGTEYEPHGYNQYSKSLYVVEGVFKASKLHSLGRRAIGVLGNNPKRMKPLFKILSQRYNLIALADNDDAGMKLLNLIGRGVQTPVDVDEMTNEDLSALLREEMINNYDKRLEKLNVKL